MKERHNKGTSIYVTGKKYSSIDFRYSSQDQIWRGYIIRDSMTLKMRITRHQIPSRIFE